MDDRYFSDKKPKGQLEGRDRYTKADYFDENFSLDFKKGQGNAQSFSKRRVEDDDSFSSFVRDVDAEDIDGLFRDDYSRAQSAAVSETARRIPKGAQISHRATPVHGSPVKTARSPETGRTSSRGVFNTMPGDPMRVPSGRPVENTAKKKRRSGAFKAIVAVLLVLIIAVGSFAAYMYNRIDGLLNKANYDDTIINNRYLSSDAPVSEDVINILLIGSDERGEGSSVKGKRSDTMILLTIDTVNKQIKLTSFLRDSYVYIPCLEKNGKMNSAYSDNGAQGVMDTIEYNFGIDVHNYISVNFGAFEKIIDLIGGVTVDGVTEKEARYMNREAGTDIKAGSNHMDGYEALWYCRIRKLDSDFYRTQRQRKVLSAVIDKAKSMNVTELMKIIDSAMPYITTSIPKSQIKSLGMNALTYVGYETVQQQIPADGTWRDGSVNGSYVIDFDIDENKELLQSFVYEKAEKSDE